MQYSLRKNFHKTKLIVFDLVWIDCFFSKQLLGFAYLYTASLILFFTRGLENILLTYGKYIFSASKC